MGLKLEVGKFYRTRDGLKAGPVTPVKDSDILVSAKLVDIGTYHNFFWDGRYKLIEKSDLDLVAPWNASDDATSPSGLRDSADETDELTTLVQQANAGLDALAILRDKYPKQIEHSSATNDWRAGEGFISSYGCFGQISRTVDFRFRVTPPEPTEAFSPFKVGSNWEVKDLGNGRVKVGCQEFGIFTLREALRFLCPGKKTTYTADGHTFNASREGVTHAASNSISWDDADKLLAALEKVK